MHKKLNLVPRKLTLRREALRRLDLSDEQLAGVAGGMQQTDACGQTDDCNPSRKCTGGTDCCTNRTAAGQGGGASTK